MTNALQVFNYESREVRTVLIDGEAWLVAKDVCDILELTNPTMAVQELDEDERAKYYLGRSPIHGGGGEVNVINEAGLYKLTFKSRKPAAKKFTRWVTHEVLPTLRKTGSYSIGDTEPLNVRVRVAEVLQRLALQVASKDEREVITRTAYKYATGQELPKSAGKEKREHKPRSWTAAQLARTLGWTAEGVLYRAGQLCIGHMEGETLYFDKEERREFLKLVERGVERIAEGYEYYAGGNRRIYWRFDANAARA